MTITTTTQLKEEFIKLARSSRLEVQCVNDGAFHSEIVVVAEAPGDRECETGRPLVGGSGAKLWEVLRRHGLTRNDVYITNVCKRQVSFGQDKRHPINKHEAEIWNTLLHWEISQLPNAKYILVLGNMSLYAITEKNGITDWRGSVLDCNVGGRPMKALCAYNPAMILREPKLELTFSFDMAKLKKLTKGEWVVKPHTTHINPSYSDAMDWITKMERDKRHVAYDIETLSNETACIGFANNDIEAMCINFRTRDEQRYTVEEERKLRRYIQRFFLRCGDQLIAQNNMFDSSWLWFKDRIHVPGIYMDTMLAHHVLYPQLPHNLGYLTTQYTTRPFYKNEKDEWREGGNIDDFWRYNGQDCCNTHGIATALASELKQQSMDRFFFEHVMRAQPHLVRMVVGGILVDKERKDALKDEIGGKVQDLLKEFHEAVREVVPDPDYMPNPKSPKQLAELLFTKLRLVGRGTSTDAENRDKMYAHPATTEPKRKVLRALNDFATENKFYSTYVTTAIDDDGRLRCTYNQTGVQSAPGRLSSSGMLWKNEAGEQTGMNLQNQPERAYELYRADEGYVLGYFDLSQAEARLVACFARIDKWVEQFERARLDGSYDAHRALASEMFGMPYDEVPTFDRYDSTKGYTPPTGKREFDVTPRFIAKRCRHGLNYRMGPERLSSTTGLALPDAMNAYRVYHRLTPELQRWWGELEQEVRSTKTLFNAFGRRFIVLERLSPDALESIVAFKPQSTLGDKVVRVIYQCESDPRWPRNARMWLNIHDALIVLAPADKVMTCLSLMKKYAEEPIRIGNYELIIPAECKLSKPDSGGVHRWSTLKPIQVEAAS